MRSLTFALTLAVLIPSGSRLDAQSEVVCTPAETVQQCYQRHLPTGGVPRSTTSDAAALAAGKVSSALQSAPTGTDLTGEGPLTGVRDFLPRLAASLLTPTLGADVLQSVGLKANLPLNDGVLFNVGLNAQLAAVANEAKLYTPLVEAFSEEVREGARGRLEREVQAFDDLSFSGALNVENRRFGRSLASHRQEITRLAREILPVADARATIFQQDEQHRALRAQLHTSLTTTPATVLAPDRVAVPVCAYQRDGGPRDPGEMPIGCFGAATRLKIEESIGSVEVARREHIEDAYRRLRASGVLRLAQLINNQPQVNATLQYRSRAAFVGPSEWTGTARLELGFANMNALRRHCAAEGIRAACLRSFVEDAAVRRSLERGDRVWVQADLTRREPWRVSLPMDSVEVTLGSALGLGVSVGYGAYIGRGEGTRDRFDLQGKYDFTRDDPIRQNRFVGTLLYTLRLSDQSSALLGLTYANRPEFVGDVYRRLGANLGLTYKVNRGSTTAAAQ